MSQHGAGSGEDDGNVGRSRPTANDVYFTVIVIRSLITTG